MNAVREQRAAIVGRLADLKFDNVFNPYSDLCPYHDLPDAPAIRRRNLGLTLDRAAGRVEEIWLALEPGHRGARRTGLAMTDDRRLTPHAKYWGIEGIARATKSGPETEGTAGIVWGALSRKGASAFLWNAFPLHSHQAKSPLSNRRHTPVEREACVDITLAILNLLKPKRVFAIGREAEVAAQTLGVAAEYVRHPSFGGKSDFLRGIGAQ